MTNQHASVPGNPAAKRLQYTVTSLLLLVALLALGLGWWIDHRELTAKVKHTVEGGYRIPWGITIPTRDGQWDAINFGGNWTDRKPEEFSIGCVAFSPDGKTLAYGCGPTYQSKTPSEVRLWDVVRRKRTKTHQTQWVHDLRFSPDGKSLALATGDVELWDQSLSQRISQFTMGFQAQGRLCLAFAPDGQTFATAGWPRQWAIDMPSAKLWDMRTGQSVPILSDETYSFAFSPDGKTLAIGHQNRGRISLWDVASRKEGLVFGEHTGQITSLSFSSDGTRLLSADSFVQASTFQMKASSLGQAKLWDVGTGQMLACLGHAFIASFSPDGRTIVTAGGDGVVRVWDAWSLLPRTTFQAHPAAVTSMAFAPDSKTIATASAAEPAVKLWDVSTGRLKYSISLDE